MNAQLITVDPEIHSGTPVSAAKLRFPTGDRSNRPFSARYEAGTCIHRA
jgi:hypothetical protein